jgi:hypothetical protein
MKDIVYKNIGLGALSSRRLSGLQVDADNGYGPTTPISARYDNLLDLLQRIASPNNMGFNLWAIGGGQWEFDVFPPNDVSGTVQFSRNRGNMIGHSVLRAIPSATRAIVAGGGVGTARNITTYDAAGGATDPDWADMVEAFVDRRDTTDSGELAQAGKETLAEGADTPSLSITTMETEDTQIGRDYGLGSIVTVIIRTVEYVDIVSAIEYKSSPGSLRIRPIIGGADAVYGKALNVNKIVKKLSARVAGLERRY